MRSKGVAVILILMFALAAGAGMVAGKLSSRVPSTPETHVHQGTLTEMLHLSPEQNGKMQQIWESVQGKSRDCMARAQQVQHEEEVALEAMLTDEQKSKLNEIRQKSKEKVTALETQRNAAFKDAVDRTLDILNPDQRTIYKAIIKDRVGPLPDGGGMHSMLE